ncbi:MAG: MFS transporter [Saprospiraceae bacterium]|nr:MFS transporter [Saprospiraceae bacterium]
MSIISVSELEVSKRLPSLSESSFLRYIHFVALYFAQGVPEGMLSFGIPAWMAVNGKTPGEIAAFAVVCGLPWSFKFIVAPLIDRYTFLQMGRKRPWVIVGQIGLVISCIYMAFITDPLNNLSQLMIAGFMISFFGAFQDVATDGMAIDIIPVNQQSKANGLMWGSKVIAISTTLALGTWLITAFNFKIAMLAMASIVAFIMLIPMILKERPGEKILPWSKGTAYSESLNLQPSNWSSIFKSLKRVFSLQNSWILLIVLFFLAGSFNYVNTLLPIFTVKELHWNNTDYSQVYSTAKLIGGIAGMMFGGILIEKFGKIRMMNFYFFSTMLLAISFALMKFYWLNVSFIYGFMLLFNVAYTFSCIGIFAIAMSCCWKRVSASQFTIFMTISNLGRILLAAMIGPVTTFFNYQIAILVSVLMIAIAWVCFQFINIDKQIAELRNLEAERNE